MPELILDGRRAGVDEGHRIRISWGDKEVLGVLKVIHTNRDSASIIRRNINSLNDTLVITRLLGKDTLFKEWAAVYHISKRFSAHIAPMKSTVDVHVEVVDRMGRSISRYIFKRCWVSEYTSLPGMDDEEASLGMESLKLMTEGWVTE